MAVVIASKSTTAFSSDSALTVTAPTGIAVGDLLILHYVINDATDTIQTLAGWTHEISNQTAGGNTYTGVQWKVADSGDAAAGSFVFNATGASIVGGAMFRITGYIAPDLLNDNGSLQANSTNATFTNTVTPLTPNSLLLFLIAINDQGTTGTSAYAIVTSNPTWTEEYDFGSTTVCAIAAASATRPQVTATGNSSAVVGDSGNADSYGIMISISPPQGATVTAPDPAVLTVTVPDIIASAGGNVAAPNPAVLTISIPSVTPLIPTEDWTTTDRSADSIWDTQDKS